MSSFAVNLIAKAQRNEDRVYGDLSSLMHQQQERLCKEVKIESAIETVKELVQRHGREAVQMLSENSQRFYS